MERVHVNGSISYVSKRRAGDSDLEDTSALSSDDGADGEEEEDNSDENETEQAVGRKRGRTPAPSPKVQVKEKRRVGVKVVKERPAGKGFKDREYYRSVFSSRSGLVR